MTSRRDDVPEADALEQEQPVTDEGTDVDVASAAARHTADPEVPIDDAVEQEQPVPVDDEDWAEPQPSEGRGEGYGEDEEE